MKFLMPLLIFAVQISAKTVSNGLDGYLDHDLSEMVRLTHKLHKIYKEGGYNVNPIELGIGVNYFIFRTGQLAQNHGIRLHSAQQLSHTLLLGIPDDDLFGDALVKFIEQLKELRTAIIEELSDNYVSYIDEIIEMLETMRERKQILKVFTAIAQQRNLNETGERLLSLFFRSLHEAFAAGERSKKLNPVETAKEIRERLLKLDPEKPLGPDYDDYLANLKELFDELLDNNAKRKSIRTLDKLLKLLKPVCSECKKEDDS
ncbi:unnamed protein product [Bursaphelenchus xylophilus]|uniref:(pine wood nematode) hypothetical protein n=1 Tax=Bursaphelenchus xylophilus TaxID=6326 RepID=A0A1I7S9C3_BURXY|nr:unnamed protein product [Bursaphelenchus xylophilus]CAG9100515.1 unnamed protein product [Bursaphelenchus xylophilus]